MFALQCLSADALIDKGKELLVWHVLLEDSPQCAKNDLAIHQERVISNVLQPKADFFRPNLLSIRLMWILGASQDLSLIAKSNRRPVRDSGAYIEQALLFFRIQKHFL